MSEPTPDTKRTVEQLNVTRRLNGRIGFICPHCDQNLPVNEITECDKCGAHLDLLVRTRVPPIPKKDEEVEDDD